MFPSPLGVSYFQILYIAFSVVATMTVSVPSRGILFPNKPWRYYNTVVVYRFRPLSGYLISKLSYMFLLISGGTMFPSPLGVSYFQMGYK